MSEVVQNEEMSFEEMIEQSLKPVFNGKVVTGIVTGISPSEITVDIGTKQTGFVAASEWSDDPTVKLEDAVKKGDELELVVIKVNDQEGTVALSKKRFEAKAGQAEVEKAAEEGTILEAPFPSRSRVVWSPMSRASRCLFPLPRLRCAAARILPRW